MRLRKTNCGLQNERGRRLAIGGLQNEVERAGASAYPTPFYKTKPHDRSVVTPGDENTSR
jgi:hypothetical protein